MVKKITLKFGTSNSSNTCITKVPTFLRLNFTFFLNSNKKKTPEKSIQNTTGKS